MATVSVGPGGQHAKFEDAIAAAKDGDTILLKAGLTLPSKNITLQTEAAAVPTPTTLQLTITVNGTKVSTVPVKKGDTIALVLG